MQRAGQEEERRKAARCAVRRGMVASLPGADRLPCRSYLAVLPLLHSVWSVTSLCVSSLLVGTLPFPPCGAGGCGRPSALACKDESKVLPHQTLPTEGCTGLWRGRFRLVWGCGGLEAKGSPRRGEGCGVQILELLGAGREEAIWAGVVVISWLVLRRLSLVSIGNKLPLAVMADAAFLCLLVACWPVAVLAAYVLAHL